MSKNFEFMQKVYVNTTVNGKWVEGLECLFIAYYRMYSKHQRALLHCPGKKTTFYYTLNNIRYERD